MPSIQHEIFIAAPAGEVYDALTSTEGLSAWWTPGAETSSVLNSVARFPFGPSYAKQMKITALRPGEEVKWNCIAGTGEWIGTNISFGLQAGDKEKLLQTHPEIKDQVQQDKKGGSGTLLIFLHDDWKEYTPMFAECNYTWAQFLRSLKLFCETGKGRPWPNQHSTEP